MSPNNKRKSKAGLSLLRSVFSSRTPHLTCAPGCREDASKPYEENENDVVSSPTFSLNLSPRRSKVGESVAVVKESHDPYLDFRHSMLQMIFEKEMLAPEDLQELLACFLRLNSPSHHHHIIRAFSEIWGSVMSPPALPDPSPTFRGPYCLN